jgi:hypothetical protein
MKDKTREFDMKLFGIRKIDLEYPIKIENCIIFGLYKLKDKLASISKTESNDYYTVLFNPSHGQINSSSIRFYRLEAAEDYIVVNLK